MLQRKDQLTKLKEKVERCLQNHVRTRNCDIDLMRDVRQEFYDIDTRYVSKDDLKRLPTQESVKRIRAKLQNELNIYLPTKREVAKRRGLNREAREEFLGYRKKPSQNRLI